MSPLKYNCCLDTMRPSSILLICITLVSVSFGQLLKEEPTASDAPYRVFTERLRLLSSEHGGHTMDCAQARAKFGSVDECAQKRFEKGKPFFLGYPNPPNPRFVFAYGRS